MCCWPMAAIAPNALPRNIFTEGDTWDELLRNAVEATAATQSDHVKCLTLFFKEPQPIKLVSRSVLVAHFETAPLRHKARFRFGERNPHPTVLIRFHTGPALHLEFEECAGAQEPVHFTHVV